MKITTSYTIRTGDDLLCAGKSPFSKAIALYNRVHGAKGTASTITHVAKVFLENDLWVYESTTMNKWCGKSGVQTNLFSDWIRNYNGKVYVRLVGFEDYLSLSFGDKMLFTNHRYSMFGTPYESGVDGIVELASTALKKKKARTAKVHCSETSILANQAMGIYKKNVNPAKMPPFEFWTGGRYEKHFLKGYSAGKIIRIK